MKSLVLHTASGIVGSTLATLVLQTGSLILGALTIAACLSFVAVQLVSGPRG